VRSTKQWVHNSRKLLVLAVALGMALPAWAQFMTSAPAPPTNVLPPYLKHVGIEQHLNGQLPLNLEFQDETGKTVKLSDYFGKKPVVMALVYYTCPVLCDQVMAGMASSLKVLSFDMGKDYQVLTVSFNPKETPQQAAAKKAEFVQRYGRPGAAAGWHALVGQQPAIDALTKAAGFEYEYDPHTGQYAHAAAIMLVTPEGKISQYYYGVEYPPNDLRLGLVQASHNQIGNFVDQVLLYCCTYNPDTGRYGAIISHVLQVAGALTILVLGSFMLILFRLGSRSKHPGTLQAK
jgi:protein SCO1